MIHINACPRCQGAILECAPPAEENAMCINCGWRRREISLEIQAQVRDRLGQPDVEE